MKNLLTRRGRRSVTVVLAAAGFSFDGGTLSWSRDFGGDEFVIETDNDTGLLAAFIFRHCDEAIRFRRVFPTAAGALEHFRSHGLPT